MVKISSPFLVGKQLLTMHPDLPSLTPPMIFECCKQRNKDESLSMEQVDIINNKVSENIDETSRSYTSSTNLVKIVTFSKCLLLQKKKQLWTNLLVRAIR